MISNKINNINLDEFYDIPKYKGMFKIDKKGNILNTKTNKIYTINYSKNYAKVTAKYNNKAYNIEIHRALAETFIENPNPDIYIEVDHINRNKHDNRLENLKWVTKEENNQNRIITRIVHIYKTDLNYNLIHVYESANKCCIAEKMQYSTLIKLLRKECRGKNVFSNNVGLSNIYGDYRFMLKEEYDKNKSKTAFNMADSLS